MTVYLAMWDDLDSHDILGVFTSEERAERECDLSHAQDPLHRRRDDYSVCEYELDSRTFDVTVQGGGGPVSKETSVQPSR